MIDSKKQRHEMGEVGSAKTDSKVRDGNALGQSINYLIKKAD